MANNVIYFSDFLRENGIDFKKFLENCKPENQNWLSGNDDYDYYISLEELIAKGSADWFTCAFSFRGSRFFEADMLFKLADKWESFRNLYTPNELQFARVSELDNFYKGLTKADLVVEKDETEIETLSLFVFLELNGIKKEDFLENCKTENQRWVNTSSYYEDATRFFELTYPRDWIVDAFNFSYSMFDKEKLKKLSKHWKKLVYKAKELDIKVVAE